LKTKGSQPIKLPLKSLKENEKREKTYLLYILRRKSNLLLARLNLHLRKKTIEIMKGFILK